MIYLNILENTLSAIPPFPLLPLESLLRAIYIFVGGHIEFDVEYILSVCVTYVPYSNMPNHFLTYDVYIPPLKISNMAEFNHFVTLEYENTISKINHHWNHFHPASHNFSTITPGEPAY
jgi:hypothetical protein